ncbi:unnamed protein product [Ilex paraguariensis]|uniref:Uncharacterized protein n=1 Tax=Ilex paraguariensis TaxID=185542 RepID=A0ABC8SGS1_9AQUA
MKNPRSSRALFAMKVQKEALNKWYCRNAGLQNADAKNPKRFQEAESSVAEEPPLKGKEPQRLEGIEMALKQHMINCPLEADQRDYEDLEREEQTQEVEEAKMSPTVFFIKMVEEQQLQSPQEVISESS